MKKYILAIFFGLLASAAFAGNSPTADEIAAKADQASFYHGTDAKGKIEMVITDSQGRTRKRAFNMLRKNDADSRDQKFFAFFQSPADVRKMVFMVHKHAGTETDDDRWLYMPGLDLVKRIAAGDKRTSFIGSDFLYEDISGRGPDEDRHELVKTTDFDYILKNIPKKPDSVEFAYYLAHIDKVTFLPMKIEFYKSGDRLYRVIESIDIEEIEAEEDGKPVVYYTITKSLAKDLENGSRTEMIRSGIRYNIGVKDRIFSERYLRRPPREAMR